MLIYRTIVEVSVTYRDMPATQHLGAFRNWNQDFVGIRVSMCYMFRESVKKISEKRSEIVPDGCIVSRF